jgi:hypothetical protein
MIRTGTAALAQSGSRFSEKIMLNQRDEIIKIAPMAFLAVKRIRPLILLPQRGTWIGGRGNL